MFPSQNPASTEYAAQKQKLANPTPAPQQPTASGIAGTSGGSANAAAVSSNPNMQQRPQQASNATQPKAAAPYIPQPQQPAPQRNYYGQPAKPVGQQPAQAYQPPQMSSQTAAGFGMPAGSGQPSSPEPIAPSPLAPRQNADQVEGMSSAPGPAGLASFLGAQANPGSTSYLSDSGSSMSGIRQSGPTAEDQSSNMRGAAANDSAAALKQQLMSQGMSEEDAHKQATSQWDQQMQEPHGAPHRSMRQRSYYGS